MDTASPPPPNDADAPGPQAYAFAGFVLDLDRGCLRRGDQELRLRPKSFDLLCFLVRHRQRLLSKAELLAALWPDTFVTEDSLVQCVLELRRALGDQEQVLIRTVPKRGYLFAATVEEAVASESRAAAEGVARNAPAATGSPPGAVSAGGATEAGVAPEPGGPDLASGTSLAAGLRRRRLGVAAAALAGFAVLVGVAWLAFLRLRDADAPAPPTVLAVLPFAPLGPDDGKSAEYLELGLADALITQLGRIPDLVVRPTGSVRRFARPDVEPLDAGRQLDADVLVTGGVQAAGERLRVTVHVLRVDDGGTIWTGAFEESLRDLFAVQDTIGVKIAESLAPELGGTPPRDLSAPLTTNAEAYEHYLRGRALWTRRSRDPLLEAARHFERATALDPRFAHAYAALGQVLGPLGFLNYLPAAEVRQRMRRAAETALRLDPDLGDAHAALAACLSFHEWRWAEAEAEYQRALSVDPNNATARAWYGLMLLAEGRHDEALVQRERAVALDPLSASYTAEMGIHYLLRGDLERSRELQQRALELEPHLWRAKLNLGEIEEAAGRLDAAIASFREAVADSGEAPIALAELAAALSDAGRPEEARAFADRLSDPARVPVVSPVAVALALGGLGDVDEAFAWLDRAFREGDPQLTELTWRPRLVRLASDPRYHALLERIGLAPHQVASRSRAGR